MVARAIAMDGTCTGEHGVGIHKMAFLVQEHGQGAIDTMRALKHALDPHNIMNTRQSRTLVATASSFY